MKLIGERDAFSLHWPSDYHLPFTIIVHPASSLYANGALRIANANSSQIRRESVNNCNIGSLLSEYKQENAPEAN